MIKPLIICFLVCFVSILAAQDYLGDDLPFFEKKKQLYQLWLDANGMGEALAVDSVRLQKKGTELELFLSLRTADPDTAAALWQALESSFAKSNSQQRIGTALFYTFTRMMEISPAQGNVQLYIPSITGTGYNRCFYISFWQENGEVASDSRINNCRAKDIYVEVRRPQIKTVSEKVHTQVHSREDTRIVFDEVLQYALDRYETNRCDGRSPQVEEEERSDYRLVFTVTDLCREVLTDEQPSALCRLARAWFNLDCNDMRRERLEFSITYIPTREGYLLQGQLTGKFGSGVYRPRKGAYMDMEPDFEDYLTDYIRRFQQDLSRHLEKR